MEGRRVLPHMTVEQNLIIGGHMFPVGAAMRQALDSGVRSDPAPGRVAKTHVAGYLSGGEQQMLVIGRAIMAEPKLMLIDEPSLGPGAAHGRGSVQPCCTTCASRGWRC
jgi:branched-chain amino acid transport system ATP-binding protein